jgi:hypothetical protein
VKVYLDITFNLYIVSRKNRNFKNEKAKIEGELMREDLKFEKYKKESEL